jgi:peptidase E
MAPDGMPTALDRYLVELTGKSAPLVCFAPTASADDPQYINRFLMAYSQLHVRPSVLTLWGNAGSSLERLKEADLVLIGLGSTVNLVALWQAHGVDAILRTRMDRGDDFVIGGIAAGAGCFFQGSVTDTFGDARAWAGGFGLLPGSFCSHFDGKGQYAPVYTEAVATGGLPGGFACDDGAGIHYVDGEVRGFVTERDGAGVYSVMPTTEPTASGVLVEAEEMAALQ